MGTQGLVSVVKDGRVVAKVACGCNGGKAGDLAKAIVSHLRGVDVVLLRTAAGIVGFGCESCCGVAAREGDGTVTVWFEDSGTIRDAEASGDGLAARYASTLDVLRFSPRWARGSADHVWVANLDKGKAYAVGSYRGKRVE